MREFEFNNAVAKKVREKLKDYPVTVFFTHDETGKTDVPLSTRCAISDRNKADLFLSIHANAFGNGSWNEVSGIETFVYTGSEKSERLGKLVQDEMLKKTGRKNRGVKDGRWLFVVKNTKAPAILLEAGFMTNKEEAELLKSDAYREKVAEAVLAAILAYGNILPNPVPVKAKIEPKAAVLYRVFSDGVKVGAFSDPSKAIDESILKGAKKIVVEKIN